MRTLWDKQWTTPLHNISKIEIINLYVHTYNSQQRCEYNIKTDMNQD